jgi:arsenate reductase-like glutaredoxin family protein
VAINERDFFKNPFSRAEIVDLLGDKPASEMFNFKSPSFKQLGLEQDKLDNENLINLMLKEPRLVRRPVVRIGSNVYFSANQSVLEKLLD